jgi:hypothetical protein
MAFEQEGVVIVPHLLWLGTSFFFSLIRRTAPFSRLFRHTWGRGGSILTRILTGPQMWKLNNPHPSLHFSSDLTLDFKHRGVISWRYLIQFLHLSSDKVDSLYARDTSRTSCLKKKKWFIVNSYPDQLVPRSTRTQ